MEITNYLPGLRMRVFTSYDNVKAHGGEIVLNTKENQGTEFTIVLPMS